MLSQESFKIGLKMLEACYALKPDQDTQRIWYRLLMQEAEDEAFKNAITAICRETPKLYPSDNPVAIVLEKIRQQKHDLFLLREKQEQEQELLEYRKKAMLTSARTDEETKKVLANVEKMKQQLGLHFRKPLLLEDK